MFLSPSSIHFTSCTGHLSIEDITRERDIIEASRHFVQNMDRARLQVAEKDGHYFTLNNTRLLVFRRLEEEGRCNRVRVDCVPLNAIPQGIRMMMVAPTFKTNVNTTDADNSRSTGRGYQRLGQKDADNDRKSDTEDSNENSEDSDLEEGSDSEFEWSGENGSEFGSSDEEASEEKESLL